MEREKIPPDNNSPQKISCPRCGKKFPVFNSKGHHNFVPADVGDGKIIDLCIKCKVEEVAESWRKI